MAAGYINPCRQGASYDETAKWIAKLLVVFKVIGVNAARMYKWMPEWRLQFGTIYLGLSLHNHLAPRVLSLLELPKPRKRESRVFSRTQLL